MGGQGDVLAQRTLEQGGRPDDRLHDVEALRAEGLAPGEGEKVTGQVGALLGGLGNDAGQSQQLLLFLPAAEDLGHGFGAARDDGQQVVEVMGHAPGQLAKGLQPLRSLQLGVQPLNLGDIPSHKGDVQPVDPLGRKASHRRLNGLSLRADQAVDGDRGHPCGGLERGQVVARER